MMLPSHSALPSPHSHCCSLVATLSLLLLCSHQCSLVAKFLPWSCCFPCCPIAVLSPLLSHCYALIATLSLMCSYCCTLVTAHSLPCSHVMLVIISSLYLSLFPIFT